ncbi:pyruvate carboxylase [Erythrobacter sp. AP23]|uniref:pyruvate carboxylase n=1 Tax=Erythrobacter sp. AP23 TaxID=499656 RepID=UPI0009FA7A5E|nr:pyruvate carboxylase [Erythrobacter sp. AP23]
MVGFRKILVANRSEIAIRVFRAATELGIRTVAIYAEKDKLSLHRFKADEAYLLDPDKGPIEAYLAIDDIIRIAKDVGVDAIHPGYGLLSENPDFAEACATNGITFIGPDPETMRMLGNKVSARQVAISANVPVIPASDPLPQDLAGTERIAEEIGYPLMLKASWGGGGRGMRPIQDPAQLHAAVDEGRREAKAAFGRDEVYLEKLIADARHVEVQILGDTEGVLVHLFERDCTIQRRNQKVIERAPAPYLDDDQRAAICEAALKIGRHTGYRNAGTVEFLLDRSSSEFYFIEVNPRVQVEHTITEAVTGLDIVKAQIRLAQGTRIGDVDESGIPEQSAIKLSGHAIQCRVTTEDPQNSFIPDYGRITAYRGAFGNGIRIDGGTAYSGAVVTRYYDPLLEKIIAWAADPQEAQARMLRALREYRIRGVATNLPFLENLVAHSAFGEADYNTRFIDSHPELLASKQKRDRATKLLTYIADVTVNGHPDVEGRPMPKRTTALPASLGITGDVQPGTRQVLAEQGADGFARWLRNQDRVLVTDTTMRDAHQSLLATRMRTIDLERIAPDYARAFPRLLSMECWGGATFDVAMRFLQEDPWERIYALREKLPNIMTQMLIRGANAVGYTNYPDNVVQHFIRQAAESIDIFRIFDCFNWVENMRVAIDTVVDCGKLAEGTICYTGNLLDPQRSKYNLEYYREVARQLDAAGCHLIAIKDMAGLLTPEAARRLVAALRDVTDKPLHLHTHDTSGAAAATLIAAAEAGVDAIDAAMDSFSGQTSQPCLGSVAQALRHGPRDTGLDEAQIFRFSNYWEAVRAQYAAFESDLQSGASEVYLHEMPGGQFTNLKEQARSMGLEGRWHDVAHAYHAANDLMGDIIKVTPSSKVVGDLALMMVTQNIAPADIADGSKSISWPESVKGMLRGDLGQPHLGFPSDLQSRVLGEEAPYSCRPAELFAPADLEDERKQASDACGHDIGDDDLASFLMYPQIFTAYDKARVQFGPVSRLPTPTFFYGMEAGEAIGVEIGPGKTLNIALIAISELNDKGERRLFFELNGQPRTITMLERKATVSSGAVQLANAGDPSQIGAPMPGVVTLVLVQEGDVVEKGDAILSMEAMKMESVVAAPADGTIHQVSVAVGDQVEPKQLLCVIKPDIQEAVVDPVRNAATDSAKQNCP